MPTFSFFFLLDVFTGIASVDHDFIRVDVNTSSGETKSDVHMHVFPKKEVLERPTKPGGIPLNVALIMFDSTSAANFRRKMPNSLEYLTKNLDSLLLQGEVSIMDYSRRQIVLINRVPSSLGIALSSSQLSLGMQGNSSQALKRTFAET